MKIKKCRSLPPRFYRLRSINVIAVTYLHCSCGFGSRNKILCGHILYILKTYHPYMFGNQLTKRVNVKDIKN